MKRPSEGYQPWSLPKERDDPMMRGRKGTSRPTHRKTYFLASPWTCACCYIPSFVRIARGMMECVRALDRSDLCAARHLIVPGGTADPRSALGGLDEKSGRRDVERRVRVRNAPCHQATGVVRSRKLSIVRNVSLKRTSSGRRRARSARFLVVHTPSRSRPWIYAPDLRAHVLGRKEVGRLGASKARKLRLGLRTS